MDVGGQQGCGIARRGSGRRWGSWRRGSSEAWTPPAASLLPRSPAPSSWCAQPLNTPVSQTAAVHGSVSFMTWLTILCASAAHPEEDSLRLQEPWPETMMNGSASHKLLLLSACQALLLLRFSCCIWTILQSLRELHRERLSAANNVQDWQFQTFLSCFSKVSCKELGCGRRRWARGRRYFCRMWRLMCGRRG